MRVLILLLALGNLLQANIQGSVSLFDGDFAASNWTRLNLVDEAAPRGSNLQTSRETTGGNPQAFLNLSFDIPANREGERFTYLAVFLRNGIGFRYTPRSRGPILTLTYTEDAFTNSPSLGPGVGQARGLALRQNGKVYIQSAEFTQKPTAWTRYSAQLRAANFAQVQGPRGFIDASSQPDFSASGSEIEFGFWRGHPISPVSGSSGYPYYESGGGTPAVQSSIGVDNWTVAIDFANAVDDSFDLVDRPESSLNGNVLLNDRTVPASRVVIDAPPAKGSISLQANGAFVYSRNAGARGNDLFTYHLELNTWKSNQASVSITMRPPGLSCSIDPNMLICGAGCALSRTVTVLRDLAPAVNMQVGVRQINNAVPANREEELLGPFTTDSAGRFVFRPTTQASRVQFVIDLGPESGGCQAATEPPIEVPTATFDGACPIWNLLLGIGGAHGSIETLHEFRDNRLNRHAGGRRLSSLYYRSAREAVQRLTRNPLLAFAARRALFKYLPLVEAAIAGRMPRLSEEDRTEIVDLLARFREVDSAADSLQEAIDTAIAALHDPAFLIASGITPPTEVTAGAPALRFSRLFGGSSDDSANAVTVDAEGNIYFTGHAGGTGFITKLRSTGETIYETQLGGTGLVLPLAIAVDARGNAYIAGTTTARDLPTSNAALQRTYAGGVRDGFVLKLDSTGKTFGYVTYLGGAGDDVIRSLQVSPDGSIFLGGMTGSANFPQVTPLQRGLAGGMDAFVSRLDAEGRRLLFSTYLGGEQDDSLGGIALDTATGSLFLAGVTRSANFPSRNGFRNALAGGSDGFLTRLIPEESGFSIVYSTFVGGASDDGATSVAMDRAGNAYIAGFTSSSRDFPLLRPAEWRFGNGENPGIDAFAAKFDAVGSIIYSTLLGGNGTDAAGAVAVDAAGNLYVAGHTESGDLGKGSAPQSVSGGGVDGLLAMLAPDGALVFRSPVGGSGFDLFMGATVTATGQMVVTGTSWSADLEASEVHGGGVGGDAFVLAFDAAKRGAAIARATPALRWESEGGVAVDSRASVLAGGIVEGSGLTLVDAAGKAHVPAVTDSGPGRLEFLVGEDVAEGIARLRVVDPNGGLVATGRTHVSPVAPAITLDGAVLVLTGGTAEAWSGDIVASADPVRLKLVATGIRKAQRIRTIVGGRTVDAMGEPMADEPGLDRVELGPVVFAESGDVEIVVEADGVRSNAVRVRVR